MIFRITRIVLVLLLPVFYASAQSRSRTTMDFGKNWKFFLGDNASANKAEFSDGSWRILNLPHDWSIEGSFSKDHPATPGGGALPGGVGWYRKTFVIPAASKGKSVFIDFDGVYCNSEVWINGHYLGKRPNGYISFRYELSQYLRYGDKNVLAVRVDNSRQPNSRWYSGSGIYRSVWLVSTGSVFVDHWGTVLSTPSVSAQSARVVLKTKVRNAGTKPRKISLFTTLFDSKGKVAGSTRSAIMLSADAEITQEIKVVNPILWSDVKPAMYKAVTKVLSGTSVLDEYETPFGIRYFSFDKDRGFFLNGKALKIRGVCNHHDLGALGSAFNVRAAERQLQLLKEMGCNGLRTSHNPPAPQLLDLCDKMGFIVMDEAFDMWKKQKNRFDYHLDWDKWHVRDLEDQILRDRNHPSVMIWSIGNEIQEQWGDAAKGDTSGRNIARELAAIVRRMDPTRPLTAANNEVNKWNNVIQSGALDLIGYNYSHNKYKDFAQTWPGNKLIATETVSALQTRGHYDFPSDSIRLWPTAWDKPLLTGNADLTCSAYDNCHAPWGSTHEETLKEFNNNSNVSGMFIWTGFDYLGEPTPYPWPARSSYFGIIDLAGFPKDVYYMYQSEWTNKPVLHLLPHWNWSESVMVKKGQKIDVWAYYSQADEVELFLNGKSLGTKKKAPGEFHAMWRVNYEPGTLKAVSRKAGKVVLIKEMKTAGKAAKIILNADRSLLKAGSNDLSFITVKICDAEGNMVPDADNLLTFHVIGAGKLEATDNGSPTSMESFKTNYRKAFNGMALAVVRSGDKAGTIRLRASSPGLKDAWVGLRVR